MAEILVGTNDLESGGTRYKPRRFIENKKYGGSEKPSYDIGLIHIGGTIEFDEKVQPINYTTNFVQAGQRLQVTGWGKLSVSLL